MQIAWARRAEDIELERRARAARTVAEVHPQWRPQSGPILTDLRRSAPSRRRWSVRQAAQGVGLCVEVGFAVGWFAAALLHAPWMLLWSWAVWCAVFGVAVMVAAWS